MVKRSKTLPFGGRWSKVDVAPLVRQLTSALEFANNADEIIWGESGAAIWETVYEELSEGEPGMVGAAIGRAEAQTLRVATLYTVMDQSQTIEREHIMAALALWEYAEASARYIFGTATGDPIIDRIMEALRENPEGLTRNEIRKLFSGHKSSKTIDLALKKLQDMNLVRVMKESTGGRPVEKWLLV
jgi:hypothetical protein